MEVQTVFILFLATVAATGQDNLLRPRYLEVDTPFIHRGVQSMGARITGGQPATACQFPYQAALRIKIGDENNFCGGTLVSTKNVVTAAHCCEGADEIKVVLGALKSGNEDEPYKRTFTVTSDNIRIHEDWDRQSLTNDICLLSIDEVELSECIQVVNLPADDSQTYEGILAVASGWGRDSDLSAGVSPILRFVKSNIIKNDVCRLFYLVIKETHLCMNGAGGKSTCNGDSGGPLVTDSPDKTLVGITSFGISFGCQLGWPPAFTRVSKFVNWIYQNM